MCQKNFGVLKMKNNPNDYSNQKMLKIRRQLGEELTYSIYKKLRDLGFKNTEIQRMYKVTEGQLYKFVKSHKEVLGA